MDPYGFCFVYPDPYPHWGKILDPDPQWNQCGSTTLVLDSAYPPGAKYLSSWAANRQKFWMLSVLFWWIVWCRLCGCCEHRQHTKSRLEEVRQARRCPKNFFPFKFKIFLVFFYFFKSPTADIFFAALQIRISDPGSQTHIFDSLTTSFRVKSTIILSVWAKKMSLTVQK